MSGPQILIFNFNVLIGPPAKKIPHPCIKLVVELCYCYPFKTPEYIFLLYITPIAEWQAKHLCILFLKSLIQMDKGKRSKPIKYKTNALITKPLGR